MDVLKGRLAGIGAIAVGALVMLTPFQLAPVCTDLLELTTGKLVHMRCHYTGQAEIYLGLVALIIGVLIFFSRELTTRRRLGLVLAVVGVVVVLLPTNLGIGVCMMPMACHATAKVLYLLGGLLIADGLFLQTVKAKA